MGGFRMSTFIESSPGLDRAQLLSGLERALHEALERYPGTLLDVRAAPGPRARIVEVRLHFSRWDEEVDEDFAAGVLGSAVRSALERTGLRGSPPLQIRGSRFWPTETSASM